jgi:hypothetical protein
VNRFAKWSKAKTLETFARAEAAGHGPMLLDRRPPPGHKIQKGTRATCPCGWSSTPRQKNLVALLAGMWHALEVCQVLDERQVLDGVEWSIAPPTAQLLHELSGVSLETSHKAAG